jgi:hypothetical protein
MRERASVTGEPASWAPQLRRVLILDDEADRRALMREGLLEHGITCEEAATIHDAIHSLGTSAWDLFVCDMVLCDPPGRRNPTLRGYFAVCYALASGSAKVVVQASTERRWAHSGALMTDWHVDQVLDLAYGWPGTPAPPGQDGGCPWRALESVAAAPAGRREDAVRELIAVRIVEDLEFAAELSPALDALREAACGRGDWETAVHGARRRLFPGADDGR